MARKLFLFGAATQPELLGFIRTQGTSEEAGALASTMNDWRAARKTFLEIVAANGGEADSITTAPLAGVELRVAQEFAADPRFGNAFGASQYEFRYVEVDRLVAPQREINLDQVEFLLRSWGELTPEKVLEICLAPASALPASMPLQLADNLFAFSSPFSDFRFLGGYAKPLAIADLPHLLGGGQPTAALILFVGHGANPVNVWVSATRHVLNNGFHRLYALRRAGVQRVPVVAQLSSDPTLDFPEVVAGLPRQYLLTQPRPVLVKDFFEPSLVRMFETKDRVRTVRIGWQADQAFVPVQQPLITSNDEELPRVGVPAA
jgi:hypothetical protein